MIRSTDVVWSISANESRSLVTTVHRQPRPRASAAADDMTSSASQPSCWTTAKPHARNRSTTASSWSTSSAAFCGRPALYSGYSSRRTEATAQSKPTTTASGPNRAAAPPIAATMPRRPHVGRPARSRWPLCSWAWCARCSRLLPSTAISSGVADGSLMLTAAGARRRSPARPSSAAPARRPPSTRAPRRTGRPGAAQRVRPASRGSSRSAGSGSAGRSRRPAPAPGRRPRRRR